MVASDHMRNTKSPVSQMTPEWVSLGVGCHLGLACRELIKRAFCDRS